MPRILFAAVMITALAVPGRLLLAQAQLPGTVRSIDPLIMEWDSGPGKIDVSKYPPDVKRKYKTFEQLCGQCHPLARAVNCDFVLESDWERYIKRMMRRGRSLITPTQALESYEFAVFDSKVRKRSLYERRLKEQGSN
jgi:hypothetical protein